MVKQERKQDEKATDFGYDFPSIETFLDPDLKTEVKKHVAESPDAFTIVSANLCLWESWYVRGFEDTLMDCAIEEDFYAELLDRMTELCLAWIKECADIPADGIMMDDVSGVSQQFPLRHPLKSAGKYGACAAR